MPSSNASLRPRRGRCRPIGNVCWEIMVQALRSEPAIDWTWVLKMVRAARKVVSPENLQRGILTCYASPTRALSRVLGSARGPET